MGRFVVGKVRWGVLLLAVLALGLPAGGASASSNSCSPKCALGVMLPATTLGPSPSAPFTFTLTNEASTQTLGSADLTAPSEFSGLSVTSVSESGAVLPAPTVSGNTVLLRNLNLPPNASVVVSMQAAIPGCSFAPWAFIAKQSNDFNGPPGNDYGIDPNSQLTTTVTGSCTLAFVPGPTNAKVGADITGSGFNPMGPTVTVQASDGQGNAIPGVPVSLLESLGGQLSSFAGPVTTDANGDAAFPGISINATGYYTLVAAATGFTQQFSTPFQITDQATACVNSCSLPDSNSSAGVGVVASNVVTGVAPDYLSVGLGNFNYTADCNWPAGYTPAGGTVGVDLWDSSGVSPVTQEAYLANGTAVSVTVTIPKQIVQALPNNGASFYQICYASTDPFAGGTDYQNVIPTVTDTYIGLLQDCSATEPAPCIVSRNKTKSGQEVIVFMAGPGDVWGSW